MGSNPVLKASNELSSINPSAAVYIELCEEIKNLDTETTQAKTLQTQVQLQTRVQLQTQVQLQTRAQLIIVAAMRV